MNTVTAVVVVSCSGSSSTLPIVAVVSCNPVNKKSYVLTSVLSYTIGYLSDSTLSSSARALAGTGSQYNCARLPMWHPVGRVVAGQPIHEHAHTHSAFAPLCLTSLCLWFSLTQNEAACRTVVFRP